MIEIKFITDSIVLLDALETLLEGGVRGSNSVRFDNVTADTVSWASELTKSLNKFTPVELDVLDTDC